MIDENLRESTINVDVTGNGSVVVNTQTIQDDINVQVEDINYIPGYKTAEIERRANEIQRQSNEATRISSEAQRQSNETQRQTAETQRQDNEAVRQSNETDRQNYINNFIIRVDRGDFNGDPGADGNDGADGFSPIISDSKVGKVTTVTVVDAEGTKSFEILDGADGTGAGDMLKSVYDTDDDGVVDNAEKVNNHTVLTDVPADAVFTDTIYDDTALRGLIADKVDKVSGKGLSENDFTDTYKGNVDSNTSARHSHSNKSVLDDISSTDISNWNGKSDFSGSYNDLTNKPSIPDSTSDLTNDSGFITKAVNDLTNYTTTTDMNTALGNKANTSDITNLLSVLGIDTTTWSSSGTYAKGDIVVYNNKLYENKTGTNSSIVPSSDTTNWGETSILV